MNHRKDLLKNPQTIGQELDHDSKGIPKNYKEF